MSDIPDFGALLDARRNRTARALLSDLPRAPRPPSPVDPRPARYFDEVHASLQLTDEELANLKRDGFTLVDHGANYSMGSMYYSIYARELPVLVTTDSVLHALHRSFDDVLLDIEGQVLKPLLDRALTHAAQGLEADAEGAPSTADLDVDVYLAVARNLLGGAGEPAEGRPSWDGTLLVPSAFDQNDAVLTILQAVQAGSGPTLAPNARLFGQARRVDFAGFAPRGHYTKSPMVRAYFRAMMWLGRADTGFELDQDRQTDAAWRISQLLRDSGALADLDLVDGVVGALVGPPDHVGPIDLLEHVPGQDPGLTPQIRDRLRTLAAARSQIRGQFVVSSPQDPAEATPPPVFQVFGQRFVLDSFILSKVVFDSIVVDGHKVFRMMPSGLDVAAALGHDEAVRILAETDLQEHPYAANLDAVRAWVQAMPPETWTESAYGRWLDVLRKLHEDVTREPHLPPALKGPAWSRKVLQTALASWAELRHDTVLYAKQSYTAFPLCEYPEGYVEPYPAVFEAVAAVAEHISSALAGIGGAALPSTEHQRMQTHQQAFLARFSTVVRRLAGLAEKVRDGKPFNRDDRAFLKRTIDQRGGGSGPPRYDGWYADLFYKVHDSMKWSPEIVDVHADPESQRVLQVGTGGAQFLVLRVDHKKGSTLYVGPAAVYHEFTHPLTDRLTDEAWGERLRTDPPPRPAWLDPISAARVPRTLPQGR